MAHQRNKCAYCERRLSSAGVEWDLEHFRPKKGVDAWSSPSERGLKTGKADEHGYFLLAFEPRNYLVSCKPCNSNHKRNFFPIAGKRAPLAADVEGARSERAYMLNPLDQNDPAPEALIGFYGVLPRWVTDSVEDRQRAIVTIEVLGLGRPDLELDRAEKIMHLWNALELQRTAGEAAVRERGRAAVETLTGSGSPQANCARCFRDLYLTNRAEADEIGSRLSAFVNSHSP